MSHLGSGVGGAAALDDLHFGFTLLHLPPCFFAYSVCHAPVESMRCLSSEPH